MFQVNEVVCYENYGICQIFDIQTVSFLGHEPKQYYHMKPLFDTCMSTVIKIPADTKNTIRGVMSEAQAKAFVEGLNDIETVWSDNLKEREELFRTLIASWDITDWAKVIKSVYINRVLNKPRNKLGPYQYTDQKYLVKAEHLFNQEMAYALKMDEYDVPKYIESVLKKQQLSK